jgi:hypothetical protein
MTRPAGRCLLATALALALHTAALAGQVQGPYLIWMNLAGDASADSAIHTFTHTFDDDDPSHFMHTDLEGCWNPDAILLASKLPPGITPALVRRAIVQGQAPARAALLRLLRKGDADIKAYDGVVAVVATPRPAIVSLAASGKITSRPAVDAAGAPAWPQAFCAALPPISRLP